MYKRVPYAVGERVPYAVGERVPYAVGDSSGRFSRLGDRVLFPCIAQYLDLPSNARFLSCCKRFHAARARGDAWSREWNDKWMGNGAHFAWMLTKLDPPWLPIQLTLDAKHWFRRYFDEHSNQEERFRLLNARFEEAKVTPPSRLSISIDNRDGKLNTSCARQDICLRFIARASPYLERLELDASDDTHRNGVDAMLAGAFEPRYNGASAPEADWTRLVHLTVTTFDLPNLKWITQNIPTLRTVVAPKVTLGLLPEMQLEHLECRSLSWKDWQHGSDEQARFPRLHTLRVRVLETHHVYALWAPQLTTLSIAHHFRQDWNSIVQLFPNVRHLALGSDNSGDMIGTREDTPWWRSLLHHLPRFKQLETFQLLDLVPMTPSEIANCVAHYVAHCVGHSHFSAR